MQSKFDRAEVVVIGAGLAGLTCAQALRLQGYRVVVVEKSRGLGGRLATRRLPQAFADHGARYFEAQGDFSAQLIQTLCVQKVIQPWTTEIPEWFSEEIGADIQRYASPNGMTAAAKWLATGLNIHRGQRVQAIAFDPTTQTWDLSLEPVAEPIPPIQAKALVVAIPAPQALNLLEPIAPALDFLDKLRSLHFEACLTAIVAYPASDFLEMPDWLALSESQDPEIAWISLDNSKAPADSPPVLTIQSTAAFAEQHLEAEDLEAIGHHLLSRVAPLIPNFPPPSLLQVHRWRYAFAHNPLPETYLSAAPLPLVCAGDWCGGRNIESALRSGLAAAEAISSSYPPEVATQPISFSELLNALSCA